jgi:RTX calcium-binding nonapeptide repeat (4 copies)
VKRVFLLVGVFFLGAFVWSVLPYSVSITYDGKSAEAETRLGTPNNDTLEGTQHRDLMWGREGDDVLRGYGGKDQLVSFATDTNNGGSDQLYGGADGDYLTSGDNFDPDILRGGGDDDWIDAEDNSTNAQPDDIDCGKGKGDVAIHDPNDVVVNCENAIAGPVTPLFSPDLGTH